MSKLNIELFKKVRDKIATTPEAYDQEDTARLTRKSPCGTAACVGGWADILSATTEKERRVRMSGLVDLDRAADQLGLSGTDWTDERRTERGALFDAYPDISWPAPFAGMWRAAMTDKQKAEVAVAYLDHIIETGKVLE